MSVETQCILAVISVAYPRENLDDGYRLTYGGYDYLAMRALSKRDAMYSVGNQIGVGKESGTISNVLALIYAEFYVLQISTS